jgi:beta-N-acetylhexosaminidase
VRSVCDRRDGSRESCTPSLVEKAALADRVGGMMIIGFDGTAIHSAPVDLIAGLGGAILFQRNLIDAAQSRELIEGLQHSRPPGTPPLLIAVDQEGGTVSRLGAFGTPTPSAMALGASGDPDVTESIYALIGVELAALGINLDFAPVVDVNSNPHNPVIGIRSFGAQPDVVARHAAAAVRGLHRSGVASTAKHFPGHGDTAIDSHFDLPVIAHDLRQLRTDDLPPFRAALEAGTDAVMIAHVAFPALDASGVPATLSRAVITDLLREELQFDGVVCTDCLEMKAIASRYSPGAAAVGAVAAGADLITFSSSVADVLAARAALRDSVIDGTLDAARVERSLARIDALRTAAARRTDGAGAGARGLERVGSPEHRTEARAAATRCITLVRDPNSLLPLRAAAGERIMVVHFSEEGALTPGERAGRTPTVLGHALLAGPARVQEQVRGVDPAGHEYKQLLMAAGTAAAVVCVTYRAFAHPLQARAVADLVLIGKPVIVVAAREPYDADVLPAEVTVLAAYGDDETTMLAVADVLLGRARAGGMSPVTLAGVAP